MKDAVRFAADGMLGRLAKYLRALGYDTTIRQYPENDFIKEAEREGRVLLTLRRYEIENCRCHVITPGEGPVEDQLRHVVRSLGLKPERNRILTICLACNIPTHEISLEAVESKIPEGVKKRVSTYRICPQCDKIYWWGSHADRMMSVFERSGVFDTKD